MASAFGKNWVSGKSSWRKQHKAQQSTARRTSKSSNCVFISILNENKLKSDGHAKNVSENEMLKIIILKSWYLLLAFTVPFWSSRKRP